MSAHEALVAAATRRKREPREPICSLNSRLKYSYKEDGDSSKTGFFNKLLVLLC